jgi:CelD/BcsL family acetyltransferase involved in cellulose biosynthesis
VKVDVVRPSELGENELSLWRQVQESHPNLTSPFLSPYFALAVERARSSTRVAVLSDSAGIIGFFPYEQRRFRTGAALAKGLSDVQALVVPPTTDLDLRSVLRACRIRIWEFDHLLGHQAELLNSAASRFVQERSPTIDLRDGFDAYEQRQRISSSSLFQSTGRKRRKLERERGPVRLVLDDAERSHLPQVLHWKSAQYRRTGRQDRFANPDTLSLVHDLLDVRQPTFSAPLTVLLAGDTVVAGHLGLRSESTLAWWFPAYDPDFSQYSPGLVMLLELARAIPPEGLSLLDLGKGDELYKERLRNREIPLLRGAAAQAEAMAVANSARHWPRERAMRLVLESPRLRAWARSSLNQFGALRERARAGNKG